VKTDDTHPFFISDQGSKEPSTVIKIYSPKMFDEGIVTGETLQFKIPKNFDGDITYYCVPHWEDMAKTLVIASCD
jgi:hypothetical protein